MENQNILVILLTQLHKRTYTEFNDEYQLFLPLSLEGLIPEDDSVLLMSHISEGLNYTELYKVYSSARRNPALEPQTMFKIMPYAYSRTFIQPENFFDSWKFKFKSFDLQMIL